LTTGPPFTVYSGVQQTGAGGAGATDRPDLLAMPNFSTGRTVREDYFGMGAANGHSSKSPSTSPVDRPKTTAVSARLAAAHFVAPASAILTWP